MLAANVLKYSCGLQLNREGGKELHWTEYGVGGGTCQGGNCVARTAADASYYPFYGIWGPYRPETDPWKLQARLLSASPLCQARPLAF